MFRFEQPILFKHCDPAGIVFYPRYFEMMNDCVETFFTKAVEWPFHAMHPNCAVPAAEINTRFTAPSRHGDDLVLLLELTRVGRTSCGIAITAKSGEQTRFATEMTLVLVNEKGKPIAWPAAIKERLAELKEEPIP